MRAAVAAEIAKTMLRHGKEQDDMLLAIEPICDAEEWRQAKLMVGHVLAGIWLESLTPIFSRAPRSHPAGLGFQAEVVPTAKRPVSPRAFRILEPTL